MVIIVPSYNHDLYQFNSDEIRISSVDCVQFSRSSERKCCLASSIWPSQAINAYYPLAVYANPVDNVSVTIEQIEWQVEKETRNDVDIGLYVEQDESNPVIWVSKIVFIESDVILSIQNIQFKQFPYSVTSTPPIILFRVTANTTNSSHSICNSIQFNGEL